jgi:RNA polymerase sigma-70 factor (ECF subfamily)
MSIRESDLKALMLAALSGDSAAHRAMLSASADAVRAFLRNRLRHAPDEVEDIVQETILAIHTKRDTYDPNLPITAWIYAIARYRLIDHVRRMKRRGVSIPVEDADGLFTAPDAEASDAKRDVAALLALLPEKQRESIRLVKLEDFSVREAAAQLGLSESDVKISTHRGLKTLQKLMGGQG